MVEVERLNDMVELSFERFTAIVKPSGKNLVTQAEGQAQEVRMASRSLGLPVAYDDLTTGKVRVTYQIDVANRAHSELEALHFEDADRRTGKTLGEGFYPRASSKQGNLAEIKYKNGSANENKQLGGVNVVNTHCPSST